VKIQIEYLQKTEVKVASGDTSNLKNEPNPTAIEGETADISHLKNGGSFDAWKYGKKIGREETVIYKGILIAKRVAPHFVAMVNAAKKDGINLNLNSGFRTNEDQTINGRTSSGQSRLYDRYKHTKGEHHTFSGHSKSDTKKGNLAAYPGRSNHQNGRAFDLSPTRKGQEGLDWLVQNGWKYGFIRTVAKERWHWEFRPGEKMFSKVNKDHPTWDGLPQKYGLA
jgi:LAS superfamily LD-carboxypeptidase LdcB